MPRRILGPLAALGVSLVALPSPVVPAYGQAAEPAPSVLIEGKGFGHGVGMAQDGAYSMAAAGSSATAILAHFYPGTSLGRRGGTVQVHVHEASGPVVVSLPAGGEVRDSLSGPQSPGFPVTVAPGGTVQLAFAGGMYRAKPVSGASLARVATPTTAPPRPVAAPTVAPAPAAQAPPPTGLLAPLLTALAPTTVPPSRTGAPATATPGAAVPPPPPPTEAVTARGLWAVPKADSVVALPAQDRRYRGTIQATAGGGGLQLTNTVDVEQYLRGMAEVPESWPAAALQAHAIAARTFAMRAAAAGQALCDDQQCQVYVGAGNEHPAPTAAAVATRGRVLMFQGALAEAVYSASAGGRSATAEEGFGPGSPDLAYLQPTSYEVADPQPWAVTAPLSQLAARFGYRGEVTDVRVSRTGPSGRPLEITFEGDEGPMVVDGHRFWRELDLRSTLFTLRLQGSDVVSGAAPLDALVPGLPTVRTGTPGRVVLARSVPSLGRAPWVGLAALLLTSWALAASRVKGRRAPGHDDKVAAGPASA